MTSTIKVDNIQDQDGNNIINENANTITIGASGDTVSLASGASQSGFGRSGTVDWKTGSIKTATFTAVSGEGYFCNTTSGSFTVNLPAGSAGAIVSVQDYNNTFDSNSLTISPNGSEKINGGAGIITLNTEGEGLTLVYIDSTVGWRSIQDSAFSDIGANFIEATGGTITTSGNFKIHTFTGPGTFTVTSGGSPQGSDTVDYLTIAGGGSGGTSASPRAGGGAAGGYRFSDGTASGCYTAGPSPLGASALPVTAQAYPITVGGGGAGVTGPNNRGNTGSNSIFSTITSAGGGYGGAGSRTFPCSTMDGGNGGSGGGSGSSENSHPSPVNAGAPGSGNTPPVSPPQGNNGGQGIHFPGQWAAGGGGGGAGAVGGSASPKTTPTPGASAGAGGNGLTSCITASPVTRGGGGGGDGINIAGAAGGTGGGGNSGNHPSGNGTGSAGTTNTGGGGGAGNDPGGSGAGGSGIVIIRYKFQ